MSIQQGINDILRSAQFGVGIALQTEGGKKFLESKKAKKDIEGAEKAAALAKSDTSEFGKQIQTESAKKIAEGKKKLFELYPSEKTYAEASASYVPKETELKYKPESEGTVEGYTPFSGNALATSKQKEAFQRATESYFNNVASQNLTKTSFTERKAMLYDQYGQPFSYKTEDNNG